MALKEFPLAQLHMSDGGVMSVELYPEKAPNTVANFVDLVQSGFYNGLLFHRVVEGFVIQSGSKTNTCAGEPGGFTIKGEFAENGVNTGLTHVRGAISMARSGHPDSASTQFFICHQNANMLDNKYAAFGLLKDGFEVLDRIAATPTKSQMEENRPLTPQVIEKITLTLNGYEPPKPKRIGE